jgi:hypothetical protein
MFIRYRWNRALSAISGNGGGLPISALDFSSAGPRQVFHQPVEAAIPALRMPVAAGSIALRS